LGEGALYWMHSFACTHWVNGPAEDPATEEAVFRRAMQISKSRGGGLLALVDAEMVSMSRLWWYYELLTFAREVKAPGEGSMDFYTPVTHNLERCGGQLVPRAAVGLCDWSVDKTDKGSLKLKAERERHFPKGVLSKLLSLSHEGEATSASERTSILFSVVGRPVPKMAEQPEDSVVTRGLYYKANALLRGHVATLALSQAFVHGGLLLSQALQAMPDSGGCRIEVTLRLAPPEATDAAVQRMLSLLPESFKVLQLADSPRCESLGGSRGDTLERLVNLERLELRGFTRASSLPNLPPSLNALVVIGCPALEALPPLPGKLTLLEVFECAALSSLPELPTSLRSLYIYGCNRLALPDITSVYELQVIAAQGGKKLKLRGGDPAEIAENQRLAALAIDSKSERDM